MNKVVPSASYGILQKEALTSQHDEIVSQVRRLGYAVLDSGYDATLISCISDLFDSAYTRYLEAWGEGRLRQANEHNTMRALLTHGDKVFRQLATNERLLSILEELIPGKFILNQQNGIINPPREAYNQGAWHRDLPYQHYVSDRPLAVNALYCVDDFTPENGSTYVLPATHLFSGFPSEQYIQAHAMQVAAKAGSYILLDCMLFHSGGFNQTDRRRRAVNHVYSIPYFKQQINLPANLTRDGLSPLECEIFGFGYGEASSINDYLNLRA